MLVPGSSTPLLAHSAAAAATGISRSLRFNSSDSAYLSRTPASAGNRKTWSLSWWQKLVDFPNSVTGTTERHIFFTGSSTVQASSTYFRVVLVGDNTISIDNNTDFQLKTTRVFRDFSAWYHFLLVFDTTQSTASDRIKLYINGLQETTFSTSTYPTLNTDYGINQTAYAFRIGSEDGRRYFNGYLADIHFIDGQALTPSSFTEVSATTGQLIPKAYTGTFTGNSFWLQFADNSNNTATTLGKDTSGNGNNWTPNNFVATPAARQGYNGGNSYQYSAGNLGGGGGGGAGAPGGNAVSGVSAGAGGIGRQSSITGTAVYYGGGGGGGSWGTAGGAGGLGGGGAGKLGGSSTGPANPGTNGLGGGGGGAGYASADWQSGGAGGSGRVVIRYPTSYGTLSSSAGGSLTTVGGDYVYQWTSVGSATIVFPTGSSIPVQYLVVGGGGGADYGGGGGGGVLTGTLTISAGSSHTVTVGAGGAGASNTAPVTAGTNGGNSVFSSVIALGGGRGGGVDTGAVANSGGSGGGGGGLTATATGGAGTGDNQSDIDSLVDTPTSGSQVDTGLGGQVTGNYCTLNPLDNGGITLSNGNLDASSTTSAWRHVRSTIGITSGKYYAEITCTSTANSTNTLFAGIAKSTASLSNYTGADGGGWGYYANDGSKRTGDGTAVGYGATWGNGDVIGIALDADAGTLTFYKNGTSQGQAYSGLTSGPYFFAISLYGTISATFNFGQRPFAYTAPSGFKALCDTNLPAPVVAKASSAFDVLLWTGDTSTTRSITGLNFSPDLVWIKNRGNSGTWNVLFDVVRGTGNQLASNQTDAELASASNVAGKVSSFDANGFTLASGSLGIYTVNENAKGHVAWCWDAGTSTVTNTQGSITSSVRANASAGFSVVSWSANNTANQSIGHGLGVTPAFIIHKNRTTAGNWNCWFTGFSNDEYINLNGTGAKASTGGGLWYQTPTSSLFYIGFTGSAINNSTDAIISYCFAPVAGYSSFGSYTGNGSADGPFVFTGFRPRWVMVKRTDTANSWTIIDSARSTFNVAKAYLLADSSQQELLTISIDFCSNGFKLREGLAWGNASGGTYIYAAFAESPLNYSRAR